RISFFCFLLCSALSSHLLPFVSFFNDPATPEIYTLSLHDALPIFGVCRPGHARLGQTDRSATGLRVAGRGRRALPVVLPAGQSRSEEHTSELQSRENLVCRLLLEKKKITYCSNVLLEAITSRSYDE